MPKKKPADFGKLKEKVRTFKSHQYAAFELKKLRQTKVRKALARFDRRLVVNSAALKRKAEQTLDVNDWHTIFIEPSLDVLQKPGSFLDGHFKRFFSKREKIDAMHNIVAHNYVAGIPLLASYLNHPDPTLRYNAMRSLWAFAMASDELLPRIKRLIKPRLNDKFKKVQREAKKLLK